MRISSRRKATFAFILAALVAGSAGAQFIGRTVTVAQLGACNGTRQVGVVTDATNATTLGAGGGSATVWVTCATGSWTIAEIAAVTDLTAYLPISATTAAPIVIQGSGAGNDVSLISADDVFLTPADALTAVAGGAVTLTATAGTMALASSAGAITVTAVGATNDVTVTAADDVILAPTDALTGTVGGAIGLTTTAGAIGLTAGGTTQDITLTSVDDVILAATDDTTVAGDQFAVGTTTAVIDAGGGADEVTVAAASTVFIGLVQITKAAAPPVACSAGIEGGLYFDSDTHVLCACNASAWVQVADGSTGCS